jgi:fructose-1-phosphate kinase PfkB-like protein
MITTALIFTLIGVGFCLDPLYSSETLRLQSGQGDDTIPRILDVLVRIFNSSSEEIKAQLVDAIFTTHLGMPLEEILQLLLQQKSKPQYPLEDSDIFILNANPGLDLYLDWEAARLINLIPNGKGAYAAQALANSGISAQVFGFYGGITGRLSSELLKQRGIQLQIVYDPTLETRKSVIFEGKPPDSWLVTKGSAFKEKHAKRLLETIDLRIRSQLETLPNDKKIYFLIAGSLPPGIPESFYKDVILMLRQKYGDCIYFLLDAKGEPLYNGIQGVPDMVKINEAELNGLANVMKQRPIDLESSNSELIAYLRKLMPSVPNIIITRGEKETIYLNNNNELVRIRPWSADVVDATGAGDTMSATILYCLYQGFNVKDAIYIGHVTAAQTVSLRGGLLSNLSVPQVIRQRL